MSSTSSHSHEFKIEGVYSVTGRGTIVAGEICCGDWVITSGTEVNAMRSDGKVNYVTIRCIELVRYLVYPPRNSRRMGLIIRDYTKEQAEEWQYFFPAGIT